MVDRLFREFGLRIMHWVVRACCLAVLTYTVLRCFGFGFGFWQFVDRFATALAAFPYAAETIDQVPAWAVAAVLFVFGLFVLNWFFLILEFVSDLFCLLTKLLTIVWYGGILSADKYDSEDEKPTRIIRVVERLAEARSASLNAWRRGRAAVSSAT